MTRIPACFAENPSEASGDLLSAAPVGVDAHIDPLGSYEFAEDSRKNSTFCQAEWASAPTHKTERLP